MSRHLDPAYEAELQSLSTHVTHMVVLATGMVRDAIRSLFERDAALGRQVVSADDRLDGLEIETDRMATSLLARRAPVGDDLRFVIAVMKVATDIERVGDLAVNIAERGLDLTRGPGISPPPEVRALADAAVAMLEKAGQAWRTRDAVLARSLDKRDRAVDDLNRAAFARLIEITRGHPDQFERSLAMAGICRHLERAGDHAVNIGERVVFWVEGAELRHGGGGQAP